MKIGTSILGYCSLLLCRCSIACLSRNEYVEYGIVGTTFRPGIITHIRDCHTHRGAVLKIRTLMQCLLIDHYYVGVLQQRLQQVVSRTSSCMVYRIDAMQQCMTSCVASCMARVSCAVRIFSLDNPAKMRFDKPIW